MTETQLGELSKVLFFPVTMSLYLVAMGLYLYALAFTKVDRQEGEVAVAGTRALRLATVVAVAGVGAHLAHLITRSIAAGGRVPWGTMFEYSSVMGFGVVVAGLFWLSGVLHTQVMLTFALGAFTLTTVVVEFYKGTRARAQARLMAKRLRKLSVQSSTQSYPFSRVSALCGVKACSWRRMMIKGFIARRRDT